jgi:hypothetical protein
MLLLFLSTAVAGETDGVPTWSGAWTHAGSSWSLADRTLHRDGEPVATDVLGEPAFGGGVVAVVRVAREPVFTEVAIWSEGSSGARVLVPMAWRPDRVAVSPDGQHVAFVSGRTGLASVYVVSVEDEAPRQLTNTGLSGPGIPQGFVPPPRTAPRFAGEQLCWDDTCVRWTP